MKKTLKRTVAVLMTLALIVSCVSVFASAASKTTVKHYSTYVNLGDSIASGYGLPNDQTPKAIVPYSYGAQIAYAVQADYYYAYAQRGYRTAEIRALLDDSYDGDSLTDSQEMLDASANYTTKASLAKQSKGYQKAVKSANLITLDVGFNDLWIPLQHFVNQMTGNTITAVATFPVLTAQTVYAWSAEFMVNYSAIVSKLVELNPNATIILVGSYNPCDTWNLAGLPYGKLLGPIYDTMNAYKKTIASKYDNVTYVDVSGVDVGSKNLDLSAGGFEPHPTKTGHTYMANQILAALPTGTRSSRTYRLTKTRIEGQTVSDKYKKTGDYWVVLNANGQIRNYTGYAYNKNGKYYVKHGMYNW